MVTTSRCKGRGGGHVLRSPVSDCLRRLHLHMLEHGVVSASMMHSHHYSRWISQALRQDSYNACCSTTKVGFFVTMVAMTSMFGCSLMICPSASRCCSRRHMYLPQLLLQHPGHRERWLRRRELLRLVLHHGSLEKHPRHCEASNWHGHELVIVICAHLRRVRRLSDLYVSPRRTRCRICVEGVFSFG